MDVTNENVLRNLKLLPDSDPILRLVAQPIVSFDDELKELATAMRAIMIEHDGVGLAAPQVGVSKRVIVHALERPHFALINPRVTGFSGVQICREGCLSFPNLFFDVQRARDIDIEYYDLDGNVRALKATGFDAVVIQHEMDHLDGVLFVDKLKPIARALALKNWHKIA